uniref:Rpot1 n=1 Tax=Arundo donax TaxID=35708 RepID=A0A0A9CQA6_ARUDO
MQFGHHMITCQHHQHTNLPGVSSASASLTCQGADLQQTPKSHDKDLNPSGSGKDALDMHDL